jgi:predicted nucleic acid-binding protein
MRADLRAAWASGERIRVPPLVRYVWDRGPRRVSERAAYARLFPEDEWIAFGPNEARVAATLYRTVDRPRRREIDLAIAACAISWDGALWTLNQADFLDLPDLDLWG